MNRELTHHAISERLEKLTQGKKRLVGQIKSPPGH